MHHLINKRDRPDERDFRFTPKTDPAPAADLRQYCDGVYNQMPLKSCSANAISAALSMLGQKVGHQIVPPSRLFLYYNSRVLEGDTATDDGVTLRNAIKAAAKPGVCPETLWPYDAQQFASKPPQNAYDGISARAASYYRIDRELHAMKSCIAEGYPFVFGMNVYQSDFTAAAQNGQVNLPAANDTMMGGHAVLAVGYDDQSQRFTVLNSLGATWGAQGYFTIPFAYLMDDKLAYDFWTIRGIA